MNLRMPWRLRQLKYKANKRYGRTARRIIGKNLGPRAPFRYDLYVWLGHLAVVLLDPGLYPFRYCCNLHMEAIVYRCLRDVPKKEDA